MICPSLFGRRVHVADEHPLSFFPVWLAVTPRPVTNGVDLASRAIWVTALLERPIANETNWLWRTLVVRRRLIFWENHSDDAIVSIKVVYQAEQISVHLCGYIFAFGKVNKNRATTEIHFIEIQLIN